MKIFKRITALMLSFVMIFGLIPYNAFAIELVYSIELKESTTGKYVDASNLRGQVKVDVLLNGEKQDEFDESYVYPNYNDLVPGKETLCVIGPILLPSDTSVKYRASDLNACTNMPTLCTTAQEYYEENAGTLKVGAEGYTDQATDYLKYFIVIPVVKRVPRVLDKHTLGQIDALADLYCLDHKEAEEFVATILSHDDFVSDKEFLLDYFTFLYGQSLYFAKDYENMMDVFDSLGSCDVMDNDPKVRDKKAKLFTMFLAFTELRDLGDTSNGVVGALKSNDIHNGFIKKVLEKIDDSKQEGYVDGAIFNEFVNDYKDLISAYDALCTDPTNYTSPIDETLLHLDLEDDNRTPLFNGEADRFSQYMENMIMTWCTHGVNEIEMEDLFYCMKLTDACNEEIKVWAEENTSFDTIMKQINNDEYINEIIELYTPDPEATQEEKDIVLWKMITRLVCDVQLIAESCLYDGNLDVYRACVGSQILYDRLATLINVIKDNTKTDYTNFNSLQQSILETIPDFINGYKNIVRQEADDSYVSNHYREIRQKLKDEVTPKSSSKKYKANDTKDTAEKISGSGKKGSTRTITPQEGRKVTSVVVTDKDGNKIDVTLNEDGTYSFVQPASNVDVQVNYKNREITLNIGSTKASVDGETSNLDVAPVIRNDRTMLPIRFVAENLGAKVGWDEKNPNIVTISRGDIEITIHLGSDKAYVNGKEYLLDSVAFAENDRTYMPVRFISEALNAIVEWNEARPNEVKIYEQ